MLEKDREQNSVGLQATRSSGGVGRAREGDARSVCASLNGMEPRVRMDVVTKIDARLAQSELLLLILGEVKCDLSSFHGELCVGRRAAVDVQSY